MMFQVGKSVYDQGFTSPNTKTCRTMHIYHTENGYSLCGIHCQQWISPAERMRTSAPTAVCVKCDNQLARIRLAEKIAHEHYVHPLVDDDEVW